MFQYAPKTGDFSTHLRKLFAQNALRKALVMACLNVFGYCYLVACTPSPASAAAPETPTPQQPLITVKVLNAAGNPVENATVKIHGDKHAGEAKDGVYLLPECDVEETITAWAPDYYIGDIECSPGSKNYTITLLKYENQDWIYYSWKSAHRDNGSDLGCRQCHEEGSNPKYNGHPIYNEWVNDGHSQSATNPFFLSVYNGTKYDPMGSGYQVADPGFKLDNPLLNGNCAACHAPLAVTGEAVEVDINTISPLAKEGINCDFCHKIWNVHISEETNLPYIDRPGLLSYKFARPSTLNPEAQILFGPLDDADHQGSIKLDLYNDSQYCAPCHYGVFWDTPIYNTYGEWLNSSYSDPKNGQTCQDCHMLAEDRFYNHNMMIRKKETDKDEGKDKDKLLKQAVALSIDAKYNKKKDRIIVSVFVRNVGAGHKLPTGSPLRHLIMLVEVNDTADPPVHLPQLAGDTIPEWGGVGNPELGYYSGLPGTFFGYILMDKTNNNVPAISYWNPTEIILDTRIHPRDEIEKKYEFAAPEMGNANVTVDVIYRYAYKDLMDTKEWYDLRTVDIVIAEISQPVKVP